MGFILRWLAALLLLAATYNPSGLSYAHWARDAWQSSTSLVVLAGLILAVGYIIYLRATLRSIGGFGIALVSAVFAALAWVLIDMGWLTLDNPRLNSWLALLGLSLVLGIGLSWSIVRRKLTGQTDVDDVEE